MVHTDEKIDWDKIISLYNTIKSLYALCEEINPVIPTYYSEIRPRIEEISENIAILRTKKRYNSICEEETAVNEYPKIIEELKGYYKTINRSIPSLLEIKSENVKKRTQ